MIQIYFHPYTLTPSHSLNAVHSGQPREGLLLKVIWDDGATGYSDLHPWVELGDPSWQVQMARLSRGETSEQLIQSLLLANRDAQLRKSKKNIFDVGERVKNNFLLTDLGRVTADYLQQIKLEGYSTLKIKVGRDPQKEVPILAQIPGSDFKLRLDFNASLDFQGYREFMSALPPETLAAIEYVEDPCPFEIATWAEAKKLAPLALDNQFHLVSWENLFAAPFDVLVVKPAKQEVQKMVQYCIEKGLKMAVTSYMDHPVGVMHALGSAMELKEKLGDLVLECGCLTHHLYETDPFASALANNGPYMQKVKGTGVGFDKLLEALPWQLMKVI